MTTPRLSRELNGGRLASAAAWQVRRGGEAFLERR